MAYLFDPPQAFELPVSKGADLFFQLEYNVLVVDTNGDPILGLDGKPQWQPQDYPAGSTVAVTVETAGADVVVDGDIDGPLATFWEDKAVADTLVGGKLWRAVITYPGGKDVPLCNGTVARCDGAKRR
jgi:hypothetical protein